MIKKGVLIPWIAFSQSHGTKELDLTLNAAQYSLDIYKKALESNVNNYLVGKPVKPVWRIYN